jgi:hypothetical protein
VPKCYVVFLLPAKLLRHRVCQNEWRNGRAKKSVQNIFLSVFFPFLSLGVTNWPELSFGTKCYAVTLEGENPRKSMGSSGLESKALNDLGIGYSVVSLRCLRMRNEVPPVVSVLVDKCVRCVSDVLVGLLPHLSLPVRSHIRTERLPPPPRSAAGVAGDSTGYTDRTQDRSFGRTRLGPASLGESHSGIFFHLIGVGR